jgi:uncharacterized membrane protein
MWNRVTGKVNPGRRDWEPTSTRGIAGVVFTRGKHVGLSTLSTRLIVSQSQCLLAHTTHLLCNAKLSARTKISYVRHWKFYHLRLFISIPILLYPSTGAYGSLSYSISRTELGLASGQNAPS